MCPFQVELINPTGGAALGVAKSVMVTINASDNAFGTYQFADESLVTMAQEAGDVGYTLAVLRVICSMHIVCILCCQYLDIV